MFGLLGELVVDSWTRAQVRGDGNTLRGCHLPGCGSILRHRASFGCCLINWCLSVHLDVAKSPTPDPTDLFDRVLLVALPPLLRRSSAASAVDVPGVALGLITSPAPPWTMRAVRGIRV